MLINGVSINAVSINASIAGNDLSADLLTPKFSTTNSILNVVNPLKYQGLQLSSIIESFTYNNNDYRFLLKIYHNTDVTDSKLIDASLNYANNFDGTSIVNAEFTIPSETFNSIIDPAVDSIALNLFINDDIREIFSGSIKNIYQNDLYTYKLLSQEVKNNAQSKSYSNADCQVLFFKNSGYLRVRQKYNHLINIGDTITTERGILVVGRISINISATNQSMEIMPND